MEPSSLLDRIVEVFPTAPAPGEEEILGETSYPSGESELEEIKEFFGGRAWNTITPGDVFRFRGALPLLSKKALAYYTAAWMTCRLTNKEAVDIGSNDFVFSLDRADRNLWTPEQRSVIYLWLNHWTKTLPDWARDDY